MRQEIADYLEQALEIEHKLVTTASLSTACGISTAEACSALKDYATKRPSGTDSALTAWHVVSGQKRGSQARFIELVSQYNLEAVLKLYTAEAKPFLYGLQCGDTKNLRSLWAQSQGGPAAQRRPRVVPQPPSAGFRDHSTATGQQRPGPSGHRSDEVSAVASTAASRLKLEVPPEVLHPTTAKADGTKIKKESHVAAAVATTSKGQSGDAKSRRDASALSGPVVVVGSAARETTSATTATSGPKSVTAAPTAAVSKSSAAATKLSAKPLFSTVTAKGATSQPGSQRSSPAPADGDGSLGVAGASGRRPTSPAELVSSPLVVASAAAPGPASSARGPEAVAAATKGQPQRRSPGAGHRALPEVKLERPEECVVLSSLSTPSLSSDEEEATCGRKERAAGKGKANGKVGRAKKRSRRLSSVEDDDQENVDERSTVHSATAATSAAAEATARPPSKKAAAAIVDAHDRSSSQSSWRELKETSYVDEDGFLVTEKSWTEVPDVKQEAGAVPGSHDAVAAAAAVPAATKELGAVGNGSEDQKKSLGAARKKGALPAAKQRNLFAFFSKS